MSLAVSNGPDRARCAALADALAGGRPAFGYDLAFSVAALEAVSGLRWEVVHRRGSPEAVAPEGAPHGEFQRPLPELEHEAGQVIALVAEFLPAARVSLVQDDAGPYEAKVRGLGPSSAATTVSGPSPARALLEAALRHAAGRG